MNRKILVGLAAILLPVLCFYLLLRPASRGSRQTVSLPDGSSLSLERVKVGYHNQFIVGSFLQRLLGNAIPARGIKFGSWQLSRPLQIETFQSGLSTSLSIEFYLTNIPAGTTPPIAQGRNHSYRALLSGDDGFGYAAELDFHRYSINDFFYGYLSTPIFPRNSRKLHIRMEHYESGDWKTLAAFDLDQVRSSVKNWQPEFEPRVRVIDGLQVRLGNVTVRSGTYLGGDLWNHTVLIPWQFSSSGQVLTNWSAYDYVLRDASGNADNFGVQRTITNNWKIDRLWRSLDPSQVWKIAASIAKDSDFDSSELLSLQLTYGATNLLTTNLHGVPVQLQLRNGTELVGTLPTPGNFRLQFVRAEVPGGSKLAGWPTTSTQSEFHLFLNAPQKGSNVLVTLALATNIPVEFTLKPTLLDPGR